MEAFINVSEIINKSPSFLRSKMRKKMNKGIRE